MEDLAAASSLGICCSRSFIHDQGRDDIRPLGQRFRPIVLSCRIMIRDDALQGLRRGLLQITG
jgi:hypothetical protein